MIKKLLAVITSIVTVFTISTGSVFAATVKTDTNSTSTATHSLAATALSISSITSDAVPNATTGVSTLPFGNYLILWITASGGSGSYQYQILVEHMNQKGDGSGTVEYTSPYGSDSQILYQPKNKGYYCVVVYVKDSSTGAVVNTIYMPSRTSPYIDVE